MPLTAPRAGERRVIAALHGRCLYEQDFFYPDERRKFILYGDIKKGHPRSYSP